MSLQLIDLNDDHYHIFGSTTEEQVLNGDNTLSLEMHRDELNQDFFTKVGQMWRLTGLKGATDFTEYYLQHIIRKGNDLSAQLIPKFIKDFKHDVIYDYVEVPDTITIEQYADRIFYGTGYSYIIEDDFSEVEHDVIGNGESRLGEFKKMLDLFQAEFVPEDTIIKIYKRVNRIADYEIRRTLNAENIEIEIDATEMCTYGRGYGDIGSGEPLEDAGIIREYRHPLANNPGIGEMHALPLVIENAETDEEVDKALKSYIDNSVRYSVSCDFKYLKEEYPEANPRVGDMVPFYDDLNEFYDEIRCVSITTERDAKGEITSIKPTFGQLGPAARYESSLSVAASFISELNKGKAHIPQSMLDSAVGIATTLLMSARTELDFHEGIKARDPDNYNNLVWFNSRGLGISTDGGLSFRNAITGQGIVADSITSGVLNTYNVVIQGTTGTFTISGDSLIAVDPNNPKKKVEIKPGQVTVWGGGFTAYRPDGVTSISNGLLDNEYAIYPYDPPFSGLNASGAPRIWEEGIFYVSTKGIYDEVGDYYTQNAYRFKHTGRYLIIDYYVKVDNGAGMFVRCEEFATPSGVTAFEPTGKGFVYNAAEPYGSFKIDLGKPTKKERKFYIKIKGNTQGSANSQFGIRFTKMALDD